MSQEITVTLGLAVTNGNLQYRSGNLGPTVIRPDQTGTHMTSNVQDIPTTSAGTAVTLGPNIGTPGYALFTNVDATNYIEVGVQVAGTFYPLVKLKAGELALLRLATATFYARANTATAKLGFTILED